MHVYISLALILIFCLIQEFGNSVRQYAREFDGRKIMRLGGMDFYSGLSSFNYGLGRMVYGPTWLRQDHYRAAREGNAI
jgi:hypothetical protein